MKMNGDMKGEFKRVLERVKTAQAQLQSLIKKQDWVKDARRYAERQKGEVKKLLNAENMAKVRSFIEREKKELERFQKQIPGEVKKLRAFVDGQRKELKKLWASMKKVRQNGPSAKSAKSKTRK
jgi:predicted  nucleic acid-binding Zn-ribbon protein